MKKHSVNFILAVLMCSLIISCGSGKNDPYATGGEGSVAIKVTWVDAPLLQSSGMVKTAAALDCSSAGVSNIEAKIFDSVGNTIGSGGPWDCSTHTATISKVPAGTERKAVFAAKDAAGVLRYWGEKSGVTINADVANTIEITAAPFKTSTVTPSAGDKQVTFSWAAVTGATSYNVYWATSSGVTKANGNRLPANTNSFSHTGLTNGTTYYYVVTAVNSFGEGPESQQVSSVPSGGTQTYSISGKVTLNGGGLSGVAMTLAGSTSVTATTDSNGNYTFTGAANGTYTLTSSMSGYTFAPVSRSVTVNNANVAGQDFVATAVTPPPPPTGTFKLPDTGQTKCYNSSGAEIGCAGTGQDGAYTINPMNYIDNGNGTVTDNVTGLIWQKEDDNINRVWDEAIAYCDALTLGGQSDWRLPSKKELISIVNYGIPYPGPTIDSVFTNSKQSVYWSSTTDAYSPGYEWVVNFNFGDSFVGYASHYVRCVRGGQ